jgi:type II secretory pathway component GspD/PulD (secretin)
MNMDRKTSLRMVLPAIAGSLALIVALIAPVARGQNAAPTPGNDQPATQDMAAMKDGPVREQMIPLATEAETGIEDSASSDGDDLINVTVENETLENVVNMFARISGANIVTTASDLEGTVTVNLRGVKWKPALGSILDVHDLALVEKIPGSGVYTIIPKPADSAEPLIVESVFLHFTTVPEISPIVRTMMGTVTNASISEFSSRNAMVIKTTEANMAEVRKLILEMDVPGKQVVVETKFMELTDGASKKLGIRWDSLDEFGVNANLGPLSWNRNKDRSKTSDNGTSYTESRSSSDSSSSGNNRNDSTTALYDKNGVQIEDTELSLFDPNPNVDGDEIVVERTVPTRTDATSRESANSSSRSHSIVDDLTRNTADSFSRTISEAQAAVLDFDTFSAVISALKQTDGVSVISNPKIIVSSGSKDAYFTVGDREPIIRTEVQRGTQDSPGDTITAELDTTINTEYISEGYLETGIHLQVVPTVKTEELIEAMIEPKLVRRILPDKVVGENSWPRISVKEIRTTFTLRSGQTVAIGGLTDTSDDKKTSKVPLLGDIPLLGKYLFSHTADVKRQTETIIFVTLSLAEAEGLYREAGIPDEAQLVHKQLIRREHSRELFENELEDLRNVKDEEAEVRARARLLKRRR